MGDFAICRTIELLLGLAAWRVVGVQAPPAEGDWARDAWERFVTALRDTLGPSLKSLQAPVDAWLGSLPMSVAVACAVGLYVAALIWTWLLPREFVYRGAPDQAPWRDLRIWATLVVLPYVAVYCWLGR